MIEKWELAHFPFEKDTLRFKARVRGNEEDLKELISQMPVECGKPFVTLSQDFDWAFYLYKLDDIARLKAVEVFNGFSPNGTVVESPTLHVEKELPPMLEDVLEATAKSLLKGEGKKSEEDKPAPAAKSAPPPPPPSAPPQQTSAADDASLAAFEESLSTPLNPSYTFSSFIVGPNNRFTHAAAQAVAENPGKIYNPFFIYGGVGLGKTHLMQAIGQFIHSKDSKQKIVFISTEKFTSLVIEGIRKGNISRLRELFRAIDILLIDDIQFLTGSESTQDEFFHVFNSLHQVGKQIVITSDRPPKQLSTLEDRLRSRFEWGLITDLKPPNLETRVAILKNKSEQINMTLTNEQLLFLAEHSKTNIRELEGLVKKIFATTSLMSEHLDMNLLKNMLGEENLEVHKDVPKPKEPVKPEVPEKTEKKPPVADTELSAIMERLQQVVNPSPTPPVPSVPRDIPLPTQSPVDSSPPASISPAPAAPPKPAVSPPAQPEPKKTEPSKPSVQAADEMEVIATRAVEPKKPAPAPSVPEIPPVSAPPSADKEEVDPDEPDTNMALRPVEVICFYPKGKKDDFRNLRSKFNLILKKHKLKFRLARMAEKSFDYEGKLDYSFFAAACRQAKCSIALVLGPPQTPLLSEDDFAGMLSSTLEEERISLQFIPWSEMGKDYRYLNCALDLSLLTPSVDPGKEPPKA